ncbi:MAG: homoserine dehydrogenase, partial [Pseudomonadota bacterium]
EEVLMSRIHVLKFGSSVLQSSGDIASVAAEIRRYRAGGLPVIAVVSAFSGETDRRIAEAESLGLDPQTPDYACLIAGGEIESAHALAAHLDDAGTPAQCLLPQDFSLRADGPRLDAVPVSLDRQGLHRAVEGCPVLIVPGYAGIDAQGETVLLGRGGSDLSALFIASELGQPECRLIKDVDGLYDRDPNRHAEARRYETVSTRTAYQVGGVLVQRKAVSFAEFRTLTIHVTSAGVNHGTRIYPNAPDKFHEAKIAQALTA